MLTLSVLGASPAVTATRKDGVTVPCGPRRRAGELDGVPRRHRHRLRHRLRHLPAAARAQLPGRARARAASYAVNVFIFATGRLWLGRRRRSSGPAAAMADPLPQALVLTAIVIGFATTGFVIELALRARHATGTDHVDGEEPRRVNHAGRRCRCSCRAACAVLLLLAGERRAPRRSARSRLLLHGRARRARRRGAGARRVGRCDRGLPARRLAGPVRHRARRSTGWPR